MSWRTCGDLDCQDVDCRDWRNHAACRDTDPEVMQPEVASVEDVEIAKLACLVCPVRLECLQLAKDQAGGAYGIHGGQWFGEDPRRPGADECGWCGEPMESQRATAEYCSGTCRQRARRAREALSA